MDDVVSSVRLINFEITLALISRRVVHRERALVTDRRL